MTQLVDSEGDVFRMSKVFSLDVPLDRDRPSTFKVRFAVNKDIGRPATVRLYGYLDNNTPIQGATFQIK